MEQQPGFERPIAVGTTYGRSGYAQEISLRRGAHVIRADTPRQTGGSDVGPAPYELLLASLGACTSISLRMFAEAQGFDVGDITVELALYKRQTQDHIERRLSFSTPLEARQVEGLLAVAEQTPLTMTLATSMRIYTEVMDVEVVTA